MVKTNRDHPGNLSKQHAWAEEIAQRNALVLPGDIAAQSSEEIQAMVVHDEEGAIPCRVVLSDRTEEKQSEEDRQRLKAQMDKMESIERLAGGVANYFNNMLGVILGHAQLALNSAALDLPFFANLRAVTMVAAWAARPWTSWLNHFSQPRPSAGTLAWAGPDAEQTQ